MSLSIFTSANSRSAAAMLPSRRSSSTVTDTLTSEVVTTSTAVRYRSNTSKTRRRKPYAISIRVDVMSTTVTGFYTQWLSAASHRPDVPT